MPSTAHYLEFVQTEKLIYQQIEKSYFLNFKYMR